MKKIGLVPLRFGRASSEPLSDELLNFYLWLAKCVTREDYEIALASADLEKTTVAISWLEYESNPGITYAKVMKRSGAWDSGVNLVLVDATNTPDRFIPGQIEAHLANAIVYLSGSMTELELLIFLLPQLPPEKEVVRTILQQHLDGGKVIVVDDSGRCLGAGVLPERVDPDQYRVKLAGAKKSAFDLLKIKMIRRLGHFKRKHGSHGNRCVRTFYDGSECESELVQLIREYVSEQYHAKPSMLLYYREVSEWLRQPVIALANSIGCPSSNVLRFLDSQDADQFSEPSAPLIVFPLVNTGQTIESILKRWHQHADLPPPNILSILSAKGDQEHMGKFQQTVDNTKYMISYLWKVDRRTYSPDSCPMCQLRLPASNEAYEDYAMLTTYDFWEMANDAGWIPEPTDEVPAGGRSGFPLVPDLRRMMHENGAWLARKIKDRIRYSLKEFPATPMLVICPDEKGANALADYLGVIQGINVIPVPKNVINACIDQDGMGDSIAKECANQRWFIQLSSVSKSQPVMILEEFSASGSTKDALCDLTAFFGLEVLCHFGLVDFNPTGRASDPPSYALYELDMYKGFLDTDASI